MLRRLVCYRRFFPFYLRTPSQSLLSRTSASQCLILLVTPMFSTGGGPDICHYVFCRQVVYLQTFTYFFLHILPSDLLFTYFWHVLSSDRLFTYFALSCCWSGFGISAEGMDEKEFPEMTFLTEALFCYRGTFLLQRYFPHLIRVNFIQEHFVFVFVNCRLLIFWLDILHLPLLPHLFSCLRSGCQELGPVEFLIKTSFR